MTEEINPYFRIKTPLDLTSDESYMIHVLTVGGVNGVLSKLEDGTDILTVEYYEFYNNRVLDKVYDWFTGIHSKTSFDADMIYTRTNENGTLDYVMRSVTDMKIIGASFMSNSEDTECVTFNVVYSFGTIGSEEDATDINKQLGVNWVEGFENAGFTTTISPLFKILGNGVIPDRAVTFDVMTRNT